MKKKVTDLLKLYAQMLLMLYFILGPIIFLFVCLAYHDMGLGLDWFDIVCVTRNVMGVISLISILMLNYLFYGVIWVTLDDLKRDRY